MAEMNLVLLADKNKSINFLPSLRAVMSTCFDSSISCLVKSISPPNIRT